RTFRLHFLNVSIFTDETLSPPSIGLGNSLPAGVLISGRQNDARLQLSRHNLSDAEEPRRTVNRDSPLWPARRRRDSVALPDAHGGARIDGNGLEPQEHALRRQEERVEPRETRLARDGLELGFRMHVGRRERPDARAAQRFDEAERPERRGNVADERPHVSAL